MASSSSGPSLASHAEQLVSGEFHSEYELNTLWDGIFHSTTYLFVIAALYILWRPAQRFSLYW
jgi:uncharacterized membrane protein